MLPLKSVRSEVTSCAQDSENPVKDSCSWVREEEFPRREVSSVEILLAWSARSTSRKWRRRDRSSSATSIRADRVPSTMPMRRWISRVLASRVSKRSSCSCKVAWCAMARSAAESARPSSAEIFCPWFVVRTSNLGTRDSMLANSPATLPKFRVWVYSAGQPVRVFGP